MFTPIIKKQVIKMRAEYHSKEGYTYEKLKYPSAISIQLLGDIIQGSYRAFREPRAQGPIHPIKY